MAVNACFFSCVNSGVCPSRSANSPSVLSPKPKLSFQNPTSHLLSLKPDSACDRNSKFHCLKAKPEDSGPSTKVKSIVCPDCDGNGAILCTQCEGTGVNSVDHFNGRFKAGSLCWLCRGKRDILCGNCNGAGFLGGYMSTFDE